MDIKLNKNYKIITDEHNYTLLQQKDKSKTPKMAKIKDKDAPAGWKEIGYYQDLDYLYEELIERNIRLSDAKTFREVLRDLKAIKSSLWRV